MRSAADIVEAAGSLMASADLDAILVTRSEEGMTLVARKGAPIHIPSHPVKVREDEAVQIIDTDYGLAGAVWTQDAGKAQRVAHRLRHGTIWINDYHPYVPQAEWGGMKRSGNGPDSAGRVSTSTARSSTSGTTSIRDPTRWFRRDHAADPQHPIFTAQPVPHLVRRSGDHPH